MSPPPVLLYDGCCGFCTRAVRLAARLPADAEILPWQDADLDALGTTHERAERELLWVERPGSVVGGAEAVAGLLLHARAPWSLLGRALGLPGVRRAAARAYRFVADHRARLPGTTPACHLPPGRRRLGPRR